MTLRVGDSGGRPVTPSYSRRTGLLYVPSMSSCNEVTQHGRDMWWSPTIRAAVVAGMPWLDVDCPGCRTSRAIDTKPSDRLPLASVVGAHAVAPHLYPFALRIPASTRHPGDPGGGPNRPTSQSTFPAR
jgi:hypothetical protein